MKQSGSIRKKMNCGIMTLLLVLTLLPGQVLAEPEQTGIVFEDDFAVIEPETAEDEPFYVAEAEEDGFFVEEALAQTGTDSNEDPEDELIFESQCGAEGSDVTFSLYKSGRLVFSGTGEMKDFAISGDDQVPWYNFCTSIKTVEVGKGITKIGAHAFSGCTKLTDVSLPPTLLSIGNFAFSGCSSLTSIDLPYGAGTLGSYAFSGCTSLRSVTLSPNLKTVSRSVFEKCSSLESISLPDQVTSIGIDAFSGCSKLENIKLPSQLNTVCQNAFQNCSAFTSITLPGKLTILDSFAFKGCSNLKTIYFDGSAPTFGSSAFNDIKATAYYKGDASWTSDVLKDYGGTITWAYGGICGDDITWVLSGGTLTISGTGKMSFSGGQPWADLRAEITALSIESGVTSITTNAFIFCRSLKTAEIADTVTNIYSGAFMICSDLSEITFKGNAPTIDSDVFSGVTATANYPGDDPTWTTDVLQDYSGTITWKPYGEKPVILTQPVDVSVVAGGTAVFSVTAIGATRYQWFYQKTNSYSWQPVSGESGTSATYSVKMTEEMNGYKYGCLVSNAMGYVESNVVVLTLFTGNAIPIDASTFPDATFRDYISEIADTNHDGYLTDAERSAVERINVSGKKTVTSLQGVEYFTELKDLLFAINQISSIDVSKNTALEEIYGDSNPLVSLDVSKNTALTYLAVAECQLSSLDVSNNAALVYLYCDHNHLTALNILNNPLLKVLYCNGNSIPSLNLSGCPNLLRDFLEGEAQIISDSSGTYQSYEYYEDDNFDMSVDTDTIIYIEAPADQTITAKAAKSSVAVGKTTTITTTGAQGVVTYKSSNETVATVSSTGKVTAKKVGTAKITVTAEAIDNYNEATETVTIKVVPAATTSLTAVNTTAGVKLTWKKVTDAKGYYIYRNGKEIKKITSGTTVSFTDEGAKTNGTKYVYKIYAYASTGKSTLYKSKTIYYVTCPAFSSVTSTTANKATVKWKKVSKVTGYQIQYSTSKTFASGNKTVSISNASTVSKVLTKLKSGKYYYVKIRAYKKVGTATYYSAWGAKKSVKVK